MRQQNARAAKANAADKQLTPDDVVFEEAHQYLPSGEARFIQDMRVGPFSASCWLRSSFASRSASNSVCAVT